MASKKSSFVSINQKGLTSKINAINNFHKSLSENMEVAPAIRGMAREWGKNFSSEGGRGPGGKWKALSLRTEKVRKSRGFPPRHPILVQTGQLKRVAYEYPAEFSGKSMSRSLPGTKFKRKLPEKTSIRITTSPRRARMVISGTKVENNSGYSLAIQSKDGARTFKKNLPARPFWYVNDKVEQSGAKEMAEHLSKYARKLNE